MMRYFGQGRYSKRRHYTTLVFCRFRGTGHSGLKTYALPSRYCKVRASQQVDRQRDDGSENRAGHDLARAVDLGLNPALRHQEGHKVG
jgi:hypothetical protein